MPPSNTPVSPITIGDVEHQLARLRKSFFSGASRSYEWRMSQLKAIKNMFLEHKDEIVLAAASDLGKKFPIEIEITEYNFILNDVEDSMSKLEGWMKPTSVYTPIAQQPASSSIRHDPLGVVLIISPWNYPVNLAIVPLIGAIAAGNCCFLKTSRHSPETSKVLMDLLPRYLDNDCFAFEGLGGAPMITELIRHHWDHIFFTGSASVGKVVYEAAAKHMTPVTLELGGKNPVFMDESVDMSVAARRIAWGKCFNAGQSCVGPDYMLMPEACVDQFVKCFKESIKAFFGDNPQRSEDFPRIISKAHAERLARTFNDGEVVFGGVADPDDRYVAPTLIKNPKLDSVLMQDEIFGPVLPIVTYKSIDDALQMVRERPQALALMVFSDNKNFIKKVSDNTRSGAILINDVLIHFANPGLPFGGTGESGLGKYHGRLTFDLFTNGRACVEKTSNWVVDNPLRYPPYGGQQESLLTKVKRFGMRAFTRIHW